MRLIAAAFIWKLVLYAAVTIASSSAEHKLEWVYASAQFFSGTERSVDEILLQACGGDVYGAFATVTIFNNAPHASAGGLHIESALRYILYADVEQAVSLHRKAKSVNATLTPPLAAMYLAQHPCPGLGDIFYVSAVTIKQIVDGGGPLIVLAGSKTMISLLSDSGLPHAAEAHVEGITAPLLPLSLPLHPFFSLSYPSVLSILFMPHPSGSRHRRTHPPLTGGGRYPLPRGSAHPCRVRQRHSSGTHSCHAGGEDKGSRT